MRSIGTADSNLLLNHFDFQLVIANKTYDCHAASPFFKRLGGKNDLRCIHGCLYGQPVVICVESVAYHFFHANPFPVFVQINQTQCRASSDSYGSAFRRQHHLLRILVLVTFETAAYEQRHGEHAGHG